MLYLKTESVNWADFVHADINYFNNYWVGVAKNGWDLKDPVTLKPGIISHKWFDELSRLTEWFLHADINAGGPLQ